MIKEILEAAKRPKTFFLYRPRPNSKKWDDSLKKPDVEEGEYFLVDMDGEESAILFNGEPVIFVHDNFMDWSNDWSWASFSASAGRRITDMVKYLKSQG